MLINLLCLCIFLSSYAQKKEIVLFGTGHDFRNNMNQDFTSLIEKLSGFKPHMICIEAIPARDSISMRKINPASLDRIEKLKILFHLNNNMIKDSLDHYKRLIKKRGQDKWLTSQLGFFYFLNKEIRSNANYQWFLAAQLSIPEDVTDTLVNQYIKSNRFNEYYNVVFPVAKKLNLKEVYAVDDRSDHPKDIKAQQETQTKLMVSEKGQAIVSLYMKSQTNYAKQEQEGKAFEILNDSAFQNLISGILINVYPEIINDNAAKDMKEIWKKRNYEIANRIKNSLLNTKRSNKVLVTFGAAHIPLLKKYLTEILPGYSVLTYNEYLALVK